MIDKKVKEGTLDNTFYHDTIRQLKTGMECYAYKMEQVEEIKALYKKATGLDLEAKKEEFYYILIPKEKVRGRLHF